MKDAAIKFIAMTCADISLDDIIFQRHILARQASFPQPRLPIPRKPPTPTTNDDDIMPRTSFDAGDIERFELYRRKGLHTLVDACL